VVLIRVRANAVAKQLQPPGLDCQSDWRLSRAAMDFMVGDTSREVDSMQNVPKASLVERVESPAGRHGQVPHFGAVQ